jgi:hypothetical protein
VTKSTCHYDAERGWLTPEHLRDCADSSCAGCKPCSETHCALRGRCSNHVKYAEIGERTCPRCIGATRRDLAAIVDLYALIDLDVEARHFDVSALLEEVTQSGVESEAFNLIGPAAAPEQYSEKRARLGGLYERRGWCDWPRHEGFRDDDRHHPYAVLGRWDMACREQYGPQTDLFVTVSSAADYLARLLAGPFPHGDEFEDFTREIADCRGHLEQVTHDAKVPEEGRHCPRCTEDHGRGPRLVKRYAAHPGLKRGQQCDEERCRICAGDLDTWHCPANGDHWWTEHDYRSRVAVDYVQHATELPILEMSERTGITASTLRRWAGRTLLSIEDGESVYGPPRLKARGRNSDGRRLYRVADALALRGASVVAVLDSLDRVGEH